MWVRVINGSSENMINKDRSVQNIEGEGDTAEANRHTQSRRTQLASIGAGANSWQENQ